MNVKRIIVDELPLTCADCNFEDEGVCIIAYKALTCDKYSTRPDWCPLVVEDDEVCEWEYLGVHMWQTCEQHARHMYPDKRYDFCPSCGKRIKYVEVE